MAPKLTNQSNVDGNRGGGDDQINARSGSGANSSPSNRSRARGGGSGESGSIIVPPTKRKNMDRESGSGRVAKHAARSGGTPSKSGGGGARATSSPQYHRIRRAERDDSSGYSNEADDPSTREPVVDKTYFDGFIDDFDFSDLS